MKKTIALLLSLLLVFSLAACGEKQEDIKNDAPLHREDAGQQEQQSKVNQPEISSVDLDAVKEGKGDSQIIWAQQDEATKKSFAEAEKEDGAEVTFGEDGSTTIKDANGDLYVQSPDGSWTFSASESDVKLDFGWPDNEFTALVPAPKFTVSASETDGNEFAAAFADPTIEQIKAYANELKAAGFKEGASEAEQSIGEMTIYTFSASDKDGHTVELVYTQKTSGLTITK